MHRRGSLAWRTALPVVGIAAALMAVIGALISGTTWPPDGIAAAAVFTLLMAGVLLWGAERLSARRVQRALAATERTLTELQSIAGIGHFSFAMHGGPVSWSENMYVIHGVKPGEFLPDRHTFLDLVLPEDREQFLAKLQKPGRVTEPGGLVCRIRKPDGTVRYMSYDWRVVHDGPDGAGRAFGIAQDITAMRDAENAIRENETRLRDLLECTSDFIWETDETGRVTLMAGRGVSELFNAMGRPAAEMIAETAEPSDTAALKIAVRSRTAYRNLVVPLKSRDGGVRWIRASGNPRFDADGRFLGYRGVSADVTEVRLRRRQSEEHRKAEALGRLASGVAHEINNLLQPILIYSSTGLADSSLETPSHLYFSRISRATERAMIILKNVLSFARQSPPQRKKIKVADAVRDALDLIGGVLPARVQLEYVCQSSDTIVGVDPTGLSQVVTNLVTNAAEAIQGRGRIRVTLRDSYVHAGPEAPKVEPGRYCLLEVEDDGPGIPQHLIGQVFDPFFTTKSQGQGTGLGLSVVAGLAGSWGGAVSVLSQQNLRTVFTVYLPVVQVSRLAAE